MWAMGEPMPISDAERIDLAKQLLHLNDMLKEMMERATKKIDLLRAVDGAAPMAASSPNLEPADVADAEVVSNMIITLCA
jgi:hypothetical protein